MLLMTQNITFSRTQRNWMSKMEEPGGYILAHVSGTGKTFLMISFIQSFLTKYPEERPLIVSLKSILGSWLKEFKNGAWRKFLFIIYMR